ncbi:hypothetical protein [Bradyrhizobium elkanii]|uniref:Protein BatD n=1 Tax=Bradyrhizobium elkanii TaxID=29448 RepID=A0A8I1Y0G6_BRAEL|nr:hypothetical protein [Bradyrhizobium elkanii]MBP1290307.1 hypothetical protein [Bradyrhizobium elkanii]
MRYPLSNAAPMLGLLAPCAARAQENTPEPILRMTLDPPCVVVRQAATLRIEVLAPNYMMAPPKLVDFQLRNALMRQLRSPNESEERDGLTYGGVRFAFAIHPQESGNYAISRLTIVIKYAADPPATREATFTLPRIAFQPFIPHVASDMQPFPAACSLSIAQTINRSSDQLETGNAVTRTVTIEDRGHSGDAVAAGEICCPRRAQALPLLSRRFRHRRAKDRRGAFRCGDLHVEANPAARGASPVGTSSARCSPSGPVRQTGGFCGGRISGSS